MDNNVCEKQIQWYLKSNIIGTVYIFDKTDEERDVCYFSTLHDTLLGIFVSKQMVLVVNVSDTVEISRCKYLSDFDRDHRQLGWSDFERLAWNCFGSMSKTSSIFVSGGRSVAYL